MTATATQPPIGEVMAVRPGGTVAISQVDGWLQAYARPRPGRADHPGLSGPG